MRLAWRYEHAGGTDRLEFRAGELQFADDAVLTRLLDVHEASFMVRSRPADFEVLIGTNPNANDSRQVTDTDGDELQGASGSDANELEVGRDPLRKDQRASITYASLNSGFRGEDNHHGKA